MEGSLGLIVLDKALVLSRGRRSRHSPNPGESVEETVTGRFL